MVVFSLVRLAWSLRCRSGVRLVRSRHPYLKARGGRKLHMQALAQHAALRLNFHEPARQDHTWLYARWNAFRTRTRRHFFKHRLQGALIDGHQRPEPRVHELQQFHEIHGELPPFSPTCCGRVEHMPPRGSWARERVGRRICHGSRRSFRRAGVPHILTVWALPRCIRLRDNVEGRKDYRNAVVTLLTSPGKLGCPALSPWIRQVREVGTVGRWQAVAIALHVAIEFDL